LHATGANPLRGSETLKKRKLLIDADLVIYRQCAAVEKDICWASVSGDETDGDTFTVVSDAGEAYAGVERAIDRLTTRFETDDVLLCLSEGRNFRYDVDATYKANRKGTRKPTCYTEVVKRACETWPFFSFPGLEADDVLGIFASRDPEGTVLVSEDKDMQTIPCTLWQKGKLQKIDRSTADWWFFYQVLAGDTADGYPGLPAVGPVKAKAILKDAPKLSKVEVGHTAYHAMWSAVKAAYEERGFTEADAIKQARLARILRNEDWDAVKKEPILWTPPSS
jgi:5'-3' exonuclease